MENPNGALTPGIEGGDKRQGIKVEDYKRVSDLFKENRLEV